ncbi:MAG: type I-C CRISPR-associated protein Cas8c/Csd1 [Opitutaceae bacterium]
MLLKHLYDFAVSRDLLDDPAFRRKTPVRWIIYLDHSGNLVGKGPQVTIGPGKNKGHEYDIPKTTRPTGGGQVADFLVDDIGAIFGLNIKPGIPLIPRAIKNLKAKHEDYWRQIRTAREATGDLRLDALVAFHDSLADAAPSFLNLDAKGKAWIVVSSSGEEIPLGNDMLTFAVNTPLFLDEPIRNHWRSVYSKEVAATEGTAKYGTCLITEEHNMPLARTHTPLVTGLPKPAKGSGAGIVGGDKPAFWSYGLQKAVERSGADGEEGGQRDKNPGYLAPTSIKASRGYLLALQHLYRDQNHWLSLGPAWLCFWAVESKDATDIFARLFRKPDPLIVRKFFTSPWAGLEKQPPTSDKFIAATLSAAGPRIVVKAWVQMPLVTAATNFKAWFSDLQIDTGTGESPEEQAAEEGAFPPLAVKRLAECTATLTKKGNRLVPDEEKLRPEVITQLYHAALEGTTPSISLVGPLLGQLYALILRVKGFSVIRDDESRFALLRLVINRHHRSRKEYHMEIPPKQSAECQITDSAYNCGCLLSVFNSLQRAAHKTGDTRSELNTTIAERYFSSASTNPNAAFSILWRLHQHHLKKLRQGGDKGEKASFRIKECIAEICGRFREITPGVCPDFPRFFTLVEQGRFALGYYHQEAKRAAAIRAWREKQKLRSVAPTSEEPDEDEILSQE